MTDLDRVFKLLASAEGSAAATTDMIEAARAGGKLDVHGNVGSGDTLSQLADSLRLLIDCLPNPHQNQPVLTSAADGFRVSAGMIALITGRRLEG